KPPLYGRVLSAIVALGPPVLLLFVIFRGTASPIRWWNVALAVVFLVVIGHAVTIGYHRLFTHRSFVARRPLKIALAVLGTMSVPCCIATVGLPFAIGYVLYGTLAGAVGALVWAGVLRIGFSHNVTWAINSVCHRFGKQPFRSHDQSRNVAGLALFSMGESWHN